MLVVGALAVGTPSASACSIGVDNPEPTPREVVRASTYALYGEIISVRYPAGSDPRREPFARVVAKMRVLRVYKGKVGPVIRVIAGGQEGACDYGPVRVGQRRGLLLHDRTSPFALSLTSAAPLRFLNRATGGRWHRPGPP